MTVSILRYNLPAIVTSTDNIKSINPYGDYLLSVELTNGNTILSYHIKYEQQ